MFQFVQFDLVQLLRLHCSEKGQRGCEECLCGRADDWRLILVAANTAFSAAKLVLAAVQTGFARIRGCAYGFRGRE